MLDEVTDSGSWLLYALLDEILVGTPASPLRKALIDSGLGEDIIGGGFDGDLRQAIFSIGLQGMETGTADKLETLVLNTLRGLADRGIDKATIDAALNTVEFRLRENNTGSEPRGIIVLIRALRSWTYDRDPLAPLEFAGTFTRLAERLAEGERVFEHLVRQHLIENPHRTLVGLDPDRTQAEREAATERTRLEMARAAMTPAEIQAVVDQTRALKTLQDTPDTPKALATIPALKPSDLPRQGKHLPIAEQMLEEARVFTHDLPTNGIVYLDVGFDVRQLPAELLPMAELFGRVLLETGAGRRDAVALTQLIGQQTGGLSSMTLTSSVRQSPSATSWLFLRGKATTARVGALVDILRDVLVEARLDNRHRIQQLILEEKATFEQHLIPSGSIYAMRRAAAGVHEAHWANEQIGGLTRLFALRNLAETIDQDWPAAQAMIERLRGILVNRRALVLNVTADGAGLARSMPEVQRLLAALPSVPVARPAWPADTSPTCQGLTVPAQVNYVAKVANLGRLGHQITGATAVIRKYTSDTWLWDKVRVQGGAYGGYMSLNADSGMLAMLSYRDPNLLGTLEVFDKAAAFLRHLDLSQSELDRIIVGTIGDIDAYLLPDAKGFQSMEERLTGWTGETKQVYREEIFATRKADFRAFADVLDRFTKEARIAVLGSETAIAAANAERAGMFAVTKVM